MWLIVKRIAITCIISAVLVLRAYASCPECQDEKCFIGKCVCVERIGCRPVGQIIQQAGQNVGDAVVKVTGEVGNVAKDVGTKIEAIGGDGAKIVGSVFTKAGETTQKVGVATATLATTGVANPAGEFVVSLGKTAEDLGKIDINHPETFADVVKQAAGAGAGVVVSVERTAERTAQDVSSLAVSTLPAPVEKGIRHASGEVIKELEKKQPELAQLLRRLPTSIIYNHLRALAGEEMGCDAQELFGKLDTAPRHELDSTAKWGSIITTPLAKGIGISGWTVTGCRGTALGVLERDAAYSGDNIVTIDLRLVSLAIDGQTADVSGRFLRIEVLPVGRAHAFALYHKLRKGETVLTSGTIVQDEDDKPIVKEDGPWLEIHPVDDLEVIAAPPTTTASMTGAPGHFVAPHRDRDPARFASYDVVTGDSLATIAGRFYGEQHWPTIYAANRTLIEYPDLIYPGRRLNIPIKIARGVAATADANLPGPTK